MQLSCTITQLIFWAKPGNPRMESGRGGWEAGTEKEREGGREEGDRAKPGNQLVICNAQYELHLRVGE